MTQVRDVLGRARPLAVAVAFVAASFIPLLSLHQASAGALTSRSLQVTSTVLGNDAGTDVPGEASNGAEVGHTYTFTPSTTTSVTAISFEVCNSAFGYLHTATDSTDATSDHCIETDNGVTTPNEVEDRVTGFAITSVFPGVTVAGSATGWTFAEVDDSYWTLTHSSSVTFTAGTPVTIVFPASATGYFTNPTTNGTYFVHIATYGTSAADYDANYNQAAFDEGTVTSSTATAIDINTRVQETLKFSVEGDMRNNTANANTTNPTAGTGAFNGPTSASTTCEPLTGIGTIRMGDSSNNALVSSQTFDALSYFRLATNSAHGARVLYAGDTLSSGATETITAIGAPSATNIAAGQEQFGLGLIATPNKAGGDTSTEVDFDGGGTYLNATTGYGLGATQAGFESTETTPVLLASSSNIVQCDTGAVRYIANIANETAAGIYSTRVIYIASPSY